MTLSDAEASLLRLLSADVEREMAVVFGPGPPDARLTAGALRASWAKLVAALALGPAPELRDCPTCRRDCRRAATLCGNCWTKLMPAPVPAA
jgi:hypothetical protein